MNVPTCICGLPLTQPATGRTRNYCSDACRQKAYRERREFRNKTNVTKPHLDLIVCAGGNREFLQVASQTGYMLGLQDMRRMAIASNS